MKILFACRAIANMPGGVERMATAMMNDMVARGHEVSLITWDADATAQAFFPMDEKIVWHRLAVGNPKIKATLKTRLQRALKTRQLIKANRPDVVLAFQEGPFISLRFYLFDYKLKMICAERNAPQRFDYVHAGKRRHWYYRAMALADAITVQLPSYIAHYPKYLQRKMHAIPNPVFSAPLNQNVAGIAGARKILLSIGRLGYQKNMQVLINAFALIAKQHPEWDLHIYSEGDDRPELEALVAQHGLTQRILLPGARKDVSTLYLNAQLFCLASRWEGFPNNLAEAFAHGVPAVGFADCAGISDLISASGAGLLATGMNNATSLATTLSTLMADDAARVKMGLAGYEFVRQYAPATIYGMWENLLQSIAQPARLLK